MIVFRNEKKGPPSRRGPDVGLDFTDQPAPAPPGYEDPRGDMPVDDEEMPPPQGAQECRYRTRTAPTWVCLMIPRTMMEAIRQEVVHLDRDLAMDLHQMSRRFLWTPGTVPQFSNPDQGLSQPMPWPAPVFCCLVSRQGRRIPFLRVTSLLTTSLPRHLLDQPRFRACL